MEKIYVVFGVTGQYEDAHEWMVKAFLCEEKAQDYCNRCNKYCEEKGYNEENPSLAFGVEENPVHPLDPRFSLDYTGTEYYVDSVDFDSRT